MPQSEKEVCGIVLVEDALEPAFSLGEYDVFARIGKGGMGAR